MNAAHDLAFLGIVVLLALAPGPDLALVLHAAVQRGRGPGAATALGTGTGSLLQGLAAVAGVGAAVAAAPLVLTGLRWAGVVYLAALGARAIAAACLVCRSHPAPDPPAPPDRPLRAFTRGLFGNLTNPKVLLFSLAVLPSFISGGRTVLGPAGAVIALPVLGTTWLLVAAATVHRFGGRLRDARAQRAAEAGTGFVMLGLAAGTALS